MNNNINLEEYELIRASDIFENESEEKQIFIDITVKDDLNFHSILTSNEEYEEVLLQKNCDGAHISGLLCNFFYRFWPELFKMGVIYRFYTPIIKATIGKDNFYFNSPEEFEKWSEKNKNYKSKWLKGLASSTTEDFRVYLKDIKSLVPLEYKDEKDFDVVELFFDKDKADLRKEYLGIMEK